MVADCRGVLSVPEQPWRSPPNPWKRILIRVRGCLHKEWRLELSWLFIEGWGFLGTSIVRKSRGKMRTPHLLFSSPSTLFFSFFCLGFFFLSRILLSAVGIVHQCRHPSLGTVDRPSTAVSSAASCRFFVFPPEGGCRRYRYSSPLLAAARRCSLVAACHHATRSSSPRLQICKKLVSEPEKLQLFSDLVSGCGWELLVSSGFPEIPQVQHSRFTESVDLAQGSLLLLSLAFFVF
ncbi:hypothetical protein M9H77_16574 [Catharanthus roseus]|uniref:Uncharacterized protein n=1 Tax=Catharanthus roseus TaxID=4058 RepID=A0ACC0B245_CATRO|nr:hypothetical protein M9H77_16574 [Catharanthus roseus]